MGKYKEQVILFLNKIKNNRSLQVKIALIVGVLLLYHFLFGGIGNKNVEIESATQEITNRASIYSVSLENDKLKVHEYHRDDLSGKYCKNVADYYTLLRVISFDPMVVECRATKEVYGITIVNNDKSYNLDYFLSSKQDYKAIIGDRLDRDIKDNELIIPDNSGLTAEDIEGKYCLQFGLKLKKILELNPIKVVCGYPDIEKKRFVTNGSWMFIVENYDFGIHGQNEQYLVREDYSLVNKMTGEITENIVINTMAEKGSNNKLHINGVATVSKNKRFFISQYGDWTNSVAEVDKNGKITKLQDFYPTLLHSPQVNSIRASDDGKYLYIVVRKLSRGSGDLYFYIIDTDSKSMIYRKTLESGESSIGNIYLIKSKENILLIYRLNHTIKTLKLYHQTKKEN